MPEQEKLLTLSKLFKQLLVPPGEGVYTVHTGAQRKKELLSLIFGPEQDAYKIWANQLEFPSTTRAPWIFGICSDCGGGIQRGANWGPLEIRHQFYQNNIKLLNFSPFDLGDIRVIPHLLHDKYLNETTINQCQRSLYDGAKLPVSPLSIAQLLTEKLLDTWPELPLIMLGGDHSVSYPTFMAFFNAKKKSGKKIGLLHFDAHTDLLPSRLGIDLCFGSWTYQVMAQGMPPSSVLQIGIRSSGFDRSHWETTTKLKQIWAHQVQKEGAASIAAKAIDYFKKSQIEELYLSFDIDVLDASVASHTGTPEVGGLLVSECEEIIKIMANEIPVTFADIVEVAPYVSYPNSPHSSPYSTAKAAAQILMTLLQSMRGAPIA